MQNQVKSSVFILIKQLVSQMFNFPNENLIALVMVLEYLNNIRSMVIVDQYDPKTGLVKLSNKTEFNIGDLVHVSDIDFFISKDKHAILV